MSEPARQRKHKLTAYEINMLSDLVPTIDIHKTKINDDFERIARLVGCSSSTVRRFHGMMQDPKSGRISENLAATATNDFADGPARKRKHYLTAEELDMLSALVPTIGIHTKTNDCDRIAKWLDAVLAQWKITQKKSCWK